MSIGDVEASHSEATQPSGGFLLEIAAQYRGDLHESVCRSGHSVIAVLRIHV